jgi:uncharacterized protein YndB with AHSA1/START domain
MTTATSSGTATVTLQGDREIVITREFNAPKHLVYRALTEPELVKRWWNAKRGTVTECEIDLRVGGAWRYLMVTPDGGEVGFHGEFREIVPDARIVQTEIFEMPGLTDDDASLNSCSLDEQDGRTTMTVLVHHVLPEHRDAQLASGMEAGMQDAYDLLEEVAASLA